MSLVRFDAWTFILTRQYECVTLSYEAVTSLVCIRLFGVTSPDYNSLSLSHPSLQHLWNKHTANHRPQLLLLVRLLPWIVFNYLALFDHYKIMVNLLQKHFKWNVFQDIWDKHAQNINFLSELFTRGTRCSRAIHFSAVRSRQIILPSYNRISTDWPAIKKAENWERRPSASKQLGSNLSANTHGPPTCYPINLAICRSIPSCN